MLKHKRVVQRHPALRNGTLPPGGHYNWKQKIAIQTNNVGLDMNSQQPANANIFDTQILATSASPQQLNFFGNGNATNAVFSNWQKGTYYAGETLLCTHIWFVAFQLSSSAITTPTPQYTSIPDVMSNAFPGLGMGVLSLQVGNQIVLKNYLTFELLPQFNPAATGIAAAEEVSSVVPYVTGASKIKLEANPVLYPNIQVTCSLLIPPFTVSGTWGVMAIMGRQGTIYSAGGPMGS